MHGGDIYRNQVQYDFSVNLNPRDIPEGVLGALEEAIHHVAEYPDLHHQELRTMLAERWNVSEQQIVLGNGASEIISAFVQAYQPKSCLLTAPAYTGYERAIRGICPDCICHYYNLRPEQNFILQEDIADEIRRVEPDMLILTNPNNPNGKLIPPEVLDAILTAAGELDTAVMIDECFMALTGQEETHSLLRKCKYSRSHSSAMPITSSVTPPMTASLAKPLQNHDDISGNVASPEAPGLSEASEVSEVSGTLEAPGALGAMPEISQETSPAITPETMPEALPDGSMPNTLVLRAFTKTFAIPGVRLGYAVALAGTTQESIANATRVSGSLPEWNLSVFAQKAGAACLAEAAYVADSLPLIAEEREYLTRGLTKLGYEVFPSDVNYILFLSPDTHLPVKLLSEGILIRTCEDYRGLGTGYYRIAVLNHAKNEILLEAMQRMADIDHH
jgi:histidinol-phosphate/aromatic aminotransferase/cobyric acid decarboxylase-like protein